MSTANKTLTKKIKKIIATALVAVTLATSFSLSPVGSIEVEAKCPTQGHTTKVSMKPLYEDSGIAIVDTATAKKLDAIIKELGITTNTTAYDAVDKIDTWIVENIKYDYAAHCSTGAVANTLELGKTKCGGFARLFTAFCDRIGVKSTIVYSKSHGWNMVQIDGKIYYVDTTWEACGYPKKWFLLSKSEILKDHDPIIRVDEKNILVDYKITYKLNGGKNNKSNITTYKSQTPIFGGKTVLANRYYYDSQITANFKFKNPKRAGYTFKGWYYKGKKVTKLGQILFKEKKVTLSAKWSKVSRPTINSKNIKIKVDKSPFGDPEYLGIHVDLKTLSNIGYSWKIIDKTNNKIVDSYDTAEHQISYSYGIYKKGSYKVVVKAYKKDSANKKIYSKEKTCNVQIQ